MCLQWISEGYTTKGYCFSHRVFNYIKPQQSRKVREDVYPHDIGYVLVQKIPPSLYFLGPDISKWKEDVKLLKLSFLFQYIITE